MKNNTKKVAKTINIIILTKKKRHQKRRSDVGGTCGQVGAMMQMMIITGHLYSVSRPIPRGGRESRVRFLGTRRRRRWIVRDDLRWTPDFRCRRRLLCSLGLSSGRSSESHTDFVIIIF